MVQWSTTSQAAVSHGVKCLVYGASGEGKTVLCATAPRPVIISAEAGLLSLSRHNLERLYGPNNPEITYDIPVVQVTTVQQLSEVFQMFATSAQARQSFATLCLDSISEIAETVLANAKAQVKDPRQAYGELIDKMMDTIKKFRDLPGYNVYMSAKMEPMKDEQSGVVRFGPSMPGSKLGPQIPYLFDEVFRLGKGQTPQGVKYRFLQTDGDLQYIAKDRSGSLEELEPANLTHIFRKISGVKA